MQSKGRVTIYIGLWLGLGLSILLSLLAGSVTLSPEALWHPESMARVILLSIRLPRTLGALIAGVGLSLSGVLLQNVMGNPLAGPNTIGVNAGAGLGVLCCMLTGGSLLLTPLAAFAGAFATAVLILYLSKNAGGGKGTVVLAGIACTTLFQALISFGLRLDEDVLQMYNDFSVGSLSGVSFARLWLPAVLVLLCLLTAALLWRPITALSLGDFTASSLGVRLQLMRGICLLLAALSAAAVISFAGLLGFVGLVVPHIARKLSGASLRHQLATAPLVGGIVMLLADTAGRTLFLPSEVSVGILTALVGAPFFFWLLLRRRNNA